MFKVLLEVGKYYEALIGEYLEYRGYDVEYVGWSKEYQSKDIDLKAKKAGSRELSIEVKADHRLSESGNIFIEESMYRVSGRYDGWYHYCEADVICYHDVYGKRGYMIDWQKMRRELMERGYKRQYFHNYADNCRGSMYLVSVEDVNKEGWLIEEYIL